MNQDEDIFKEWAQDINTKDISSAKLVTLFIIGMAILIFLSSCSRYSAPGYDGGCMFKKRTNYGMARVIRI